MGLVNWIKNRKWVQVCFALLQNLNVKGFITGQIYTGNLKHFCVPGMNCYACPAAIGACPIGSIQNLLSSRKIKIGYYVFGFLMLIGVFLGRFVCAWLCVFGLIQELLYKIPLRKIVIPIKVDKILRYLKYVLLFLFVILFPIILREEYNIGIPYFCKYICPVGVLEGAIPLMIVDEGLRAAAHWLFVWKFSILIFIVLLSIVVYRPFCKYICPLGAFYSLFQKISFLQITVDIDKCVNCGKCSQVCKMGINPKEKPNSLECIRCGECIEKCDKNVLNFNIVKVKRNEES